MYIIDGSIAEAPYCSAKERVESRLEAERRLSMLLLIIILLLLFGGGGGYYGYSRWGGRGGLGVVGTVLVIALVLYLLGYLR
jgi:Protein of unknown function (DUF3309)